VTLEVSVTEIWQKLSCSGAHIAASMSWLGFGCDCLNVRQPAREKNNEVRRGFHASTLSPTQRFASVAGNPAEAAKAVGIGIIFDAGETGAGPDGDGLVVNGLAPNGPADRCAKIVLGDLLCTVDGMDVKGIAAADMSGLILGPPGSKVVLGFQADTVPPRHYEVILYREAPRL